MPRQQFGPDDATARARRLGVTMEIECMPRNIASPIINIEITASFSYFVSHTCCHINQYDQT